MTRRHAFPSWSVAIALIFAVGMPGCATDPYDPQTWIDKLKDRNREEVARAVTELQRLKNEDGIEKAIVPMSQLWERQGRPTRILRVVIELAQDSKGGPYWDLAVPVLRTAVNDFDVSDEPSVQNAIAAADALGKSGDKDSIQTLIDALNKPMPKLSTGQRVRLAAIAALGQFGDDRRALDALTKVLGEDPDEQLPELFAAAALALADARSPDAIDPLVEALYKIAPIFPQCRRALVAIGKPVVGKLIGVFEGKDAALNELARKNNFNVDCRPENMGTKTCLAPSNLEYKSALLLGDFYAEEAVKPLVNGLKAKPLPSYFEDGIPGPSQHTAILDSLRKIGDPSSADAVWAYVMDSDTDDGVRPMAIDVYSYLTTNTKALGDLGKMIKDDNAEEQVRMAAGIAYGRLARAEKDYEPLRWMINRYKREADRNESAAKKANSDFEAAKKAWEEANKKAQEKKDDRRLADAASRAKDNMEAKQQDSSIARHRVDSYRNFQRTFEQNLARGHVGTMCKQDPECYIGILEKSPDAIGEDLSKFITDWKDLSDQEKTNLKIAAVDRALLELRKMGAKAQSVVDKLLAQVDNTDRITRQGILLALVKVAELPCEKCVKRLDEVIEAQKSQSTLQALTQETEAVRNYFLWAGTTP